MLCLLCFAFVLMVARLFVFSFDFAYVVLYGRRCCGYVLFLCCLTVAGVLCLCVYVVRVCVLLSFVSFCFVLFCFDVFVSVLFSYGVEFRSVLSRIRFLCCRLCAFVFRSCLCCCFCFCVLCLFLFCFIGCVVEFCRVHCFALLCALFVFLLMFVVHVCFRFYVDFVLLLFCFPCLRFILFI